MHDENCSCRLKSPPHRLSCQRVKISVIVPAFNEEKLLAASLAEINSAADAFIARNWEYELVVCDNNSTDRTAEIARNAGAKVVFEPINQIARARNAGASIATGDWLVFVDADSQPSERLFAEVADNIATGKVLAGGVTIRLDEKLFVAGGFTQFWNFSSRLTRLMAGSFIFVEAAAFRQVGGFSHEFFAAEELDLSIRLKKLAQATHRKIVILHRHPIKTSARKMKLYTGRELGGFFFRSIFNHRRTVRNREAAFMWYDGRR